MDVNKLLVIVVNKKKLRVLMNVKGTFRRYVFGDKLSEEDRKIIEEYREKCIKDETRWKWYSTKEVLFEIVKSLRFRETNFQIFVPETKQPIRWLNIGKLNFLIHAFFSYQFLERPYTMHRSLAVYNGLPRFPDGPGRGEYIRENWTIPQKYMQHIVHRDIGFDVDSGYVDARRLFRLLDEFGVRFQVWCSGKKGFHFIIPDNPIKDDPERMTEMNEALAEDIMNYLNISIDLIPAGISIAYFKCPLSLDGRNNRVILPLTKEEFLNFDYDMLNPERYLKNPEKIINRSELFINPNGSVENVVNLIKSL